jgi:DNA-binding SARP family transcriptional activator
MGALRVQLLGGFRVEAGGRSISDDAWRLRKSASIVKLLALAPGHRMHRDQLLDRLWPDLAPAAANGQLRKALHETRRVLDPDPAAVQRYLLRAGEMISLCQEAWVDVATFERATDRARRGHEPSTYQEAQALYTGELLPEDRYDDWVVERARTLREEYLSLLVEAAQLYEARGELDTAMRTARRAVATDPICEPAHVVLMRLKALTGRRADALGQYELLRTSLRTELGTEPGVGTQRLYAQIKAGQPVVTELASDVWEQIGDLRTISGYRALIFYLDDAAAASAGTSRAARSRPDEVPGHV